MDGSRPRSRSHGDDLEIHTNPTLRQRLGNAATARIFGSQAADERSNIHYAPAQTSETAGIHIPGDQATAEKRPSHNTYESVETIEKPGFTPDSRVLWNGLPAWMLTWELLGIVISILFLVLGACVAHLKGQTESEWSKRVIQATRIAPSIWPILFSGVLGNAVRRFANWRAERGVRLLVRGEPLLSNVQALMHHR